MAILAAACAAAAQTDHFYADILPDTVLPAISYEFGIGPPVYIKVSAAAPVRFPDTVDLRHGATVMRIVGNQGNYGWGVGYRLTVPADAEPGVYDAYGPVGTLLESQVTFVPDVLSQPPRLIAQRVRGVRGGARYAISARATGPAFAPLVSAIRTASKLPHAALVLGKDTLPLRSISLGSPYGLKGEVDVPDSAALGFYKLKVAREDGLATELDSVFEVWMPPRPVLQAVFPDSLPTGEATFLGIQGTGLDYVVRWENRSYLDIEMIREAHLRGSGGIFHTSGFPELSLPEDPGRAGILARFDIPADFPLGSYDIGIVIAGRPDTTYFPAAVRVVRGPTRLVSFSPGAAWREAFAASVQVRFPRADPADGIYVLRRGNAEIPGTFTDTAGEDARLRFVPDPLADTGWYDFEARFPGLPVLGIPGAVLLSGPRLDAIKPMGWTQGGQDSLSFRILGAGLSAESPEDASLPDSSGLAGVRLCRGSDCLEGSAPSSRQPGWLAAFRIPADWAPGACDVVARLLHPERTVVQPGGIVIAPAGYRPILPAPAPYWDLQADSIGRLVLDAGAGCQAADYAPEGAWPSGVSLASGLLQWAPTAADTGWHAFRISGSGGCVDKRFLMAHVRGKAGVGLRPGARGKAAGAPARAFWRGGRLELRLAEAAEAEVRTVSGRLLIRFGRLPAGAHTLAIPGTARGEAIMLCRVRTAAGEACLKIARDL